MLITLVIGLFADQIDKPLAWQFGLIPSGRIVTHSFVLIIPLLVAVLALPAQIDRLRYGVVFTAGHFLYIAAYFPSVLSRETDSYWFANLFWPLLLANPDRPVGYANNLRVFDFLMYLSMTILGYVVDWLRTPRVTTTGLVQSG